MDIEVIKEMAKTNRAFGEKVYMYVGKHNKLFPSYLDAHVEYVGIEVHEGEECAKCNCYEQYDGHEEWFIPVADILKSEKELEQLFKSKVLESYPNRIKYCEERIELFEKLKESGNINPDTEKAYKETTDERRKKLEIYKAILDKYMKI